MTRKKLKVAVVYGGKSNEHEISLLSAASVLQNLDRSRFEVIPIGIDKKGYWHQNTHLIDEKIGPALPMPEHTPQVMLTPEGTFARTDRTQESIRFDVLFPVMHGPTCEDGAIQGLLELSDVAYVGAGILGSAIGMDKDVAKRLALAAGLPVAPFIAFSRGQWLASAGHYLTKAQSELEFPVFVKPANMGSSVGVKKVESEHDLKAAVDFAFQFDEKVLIEQGVRAREIEVAILEHKDISQLPRASIPGEIVPRHDFYSYEAKYLDDNGAELLIPAPLSAEQAKEAQNLAVALFTTLECQGMARVDLFLDKDTGKFYFNEVNTLPGFTKISMYPKLWGATGIGYQDLLTELIELALSRHERKKKLVRDWKK